MNNHLMGLVWGVAKIGVGAPQYMTIDFVRGATQHTLKGCCGSYHPSSIVREQCLVLTARRNKAVPRRGRGDQDICQW